MRYVLPLLLLALGASACNKTESTAVPAAPSAPPRPALSMDVTPTGADDPVLATVNGQPVTMADVRLALRLTKPDDPVSEEQIGPVLDGLIRQEIVAQAAAAAGLDKDPKFQADNAKAAAPYNAFRRRALGDAYFHAEVAKAAPVTEAEAQQFFDENKAILTSEVRVEQYLTRDANLAEAAHKQILAGKTIGDIVRASMPQLPLTDKPWELGWQPWQIVPEPWRKPLAEMKIGETSGVIAGPNKRYWVIKLVERRPSKAMDFAQAKAGIIQHLTDVRAEAAREHIGDNLIPAAKVVRHKPAAKPAVPPEP